MAYKTLKRLNTIKKKEVLKELDKRDESFRKKAKELHDNAHKLEEEIIET